MDHIISNMNKLSIECKCKINISSINNIKLKLNNHNKPTLIILTPSVSVSLLKYMERHDRTRQEHYRERK